MTRMSVLLVLALLVPVRAAAQWQVGAKGGVSRASFSGSSLERTDWMWGLTGGAFLVRRLADELSFQGEVFYVRKGADIAYTRGIVRRAGTIELDYIELPFMLRLDLGLGRDVALHLMGGPAVALTVRCRFAEQDGAAGGCSDDDRALGARAFDAGMQTGAGVDIGLNGATLVLEGRYGFGLVNIDADVDYDRTNHALGLVTGLSLPFGTTGARAAVR